MNLKNNHTPERLAYVEHVRDLVQSGHAGYIGPGGIVDRRQHPSAISMPFAPGRAYKPREKKVSLKGDIGA